MSKGVPSSSLREYLFPIVADELSTLLEMPAAGIFVERGLAKGGQSACSERGR